SMDEAEAALYIGQTFDGQDGTQYLVEKKIGDRGFAGIFKGVDLASGRGVAIKILGFAARGSQTNAASEFKDEIGLLTTLAACSNVVTLFDHGEHEMQLQPEGGGAVFPVAAPFMVLELAVGSLEELLLRRHEIDWRDRLLLFREIVKGIHQMHFRKLVHRDIKAENALLFTRNPKARIADLGRSKDTDE